MQYYGMISGSCVEETHGMSQLLQVKACVPVICLVLVRGYALGRPLQVRDQVRVHEKCKASPKLTRKCPEATYPKPILSLRPEVFPSAGSYPSRALNLPCRWR